jgi:azurin
MKIWSSVSVVLVSAVLVSSVSAGQEKKAAGKAAGKEPRTVTIVGTDTMKYDVTSIEAKPGETIKIVVKNTGAMPKIAMAHNVVVLKLGTDPVAFASAGMMNRDLDFIAPTVKDQVLVATPMAGAGETVEVTFKVPAKAGDYPYVCTFPGHAGAGMKGTLVVK